MPRTYSERFLRELHSNENKSNDLGIDLAKTCVKANLPMAYVAKALRVTKLSIFHWFRGRQIRPDRRRDVLRFIMLLERDLGAGQLPARSTIDAKRYVEKLITPESTSVVSGDGANK